MSVRRSLERFPFRGRFDDTFDYGLVKSHKCLNELLIASMSIELLKIQRNDPFI